MRCNAIGHRLLRDVAQPWHGEEQFHLPDPTQKCMWRGVPWKCYTVRASILMPAANRHNKCHISRYTWSPSHSAKRPLLPSCFIWSGAIASSACPFGSYQDWPKMSSDQAGYFLSNVCTTTKYHSWYSVARSYHTLMSNTLRTAGTLLLLLVCACHRLDWTNRDNGKQPHLLGHP